MMYGERSLENLQLPNDWEVLTDKAKPEWKWDYILLNRDANKYIVHMKDGRWRVHKKQYETACKHFKDMKQAMTYCLLVQSNERPVI